MATAPYKSIFICFIGDTVLNALLSCFSTLWADWGMMFPWWSKGKIIFQMLRLFLCGQFRFSLISLQRFSHVVYTVLTLPALTHWNVFIEDKSLNNTLEKNCISYICLWQSMVKGDEMAISRFRPSLHFPLVVIWTQSHGRSKELGKGHYMRGLALCKGCSGCPRAALYSVRPVLYRKWSLAEMKPLHTLYSLTT